MYNLKRQKQMDECEKFECDMCGLCCQNLKLSKLYADLDRGDGVCRNYDEATHRCLIYATRPIICNVEEYYQKYLSRTMTKKDYLALNYAACKKLKQGVLNNATGRKSNS